MNLLSSQALRGEEKEFWAQSANEAIRVETAIHQYFIESLGGSKEQIAIAKPTVVTDIYINFLVTACSSETYAEGVASVLPCFWIYSEIGKDLLKIAKTDNPYKKWIDNYSTKEFEEAVFRVRQIADSCAAEASDSIRAQMRKIYKYGAELEYKFWHSAYHYQQQEEAVC